ncbi:MarR family winged helix-turn-helix transcriptional regulator [Isachenkonia alkalipeptolytica]|uniref:Winged helix-turn-helix transcriptional regulator n=1 Tax=Isachenkonia alkalipeptolytica TaxID=2565777 RepID=A0AA43XLV7_9CLOT|nr:MarR family winged helix-turn-helix transcriptional regulator [Isachenkonia alkalipeptolytica]NBG88861.1 winged helix-turn-helix transcriptional regulator [Isachenkonia alkalipeptolytica]
MKDKYIVHFFSKTKKKMIDFIDQQLEEKGLEELIPSHGNILTVLYNHGELSMKEISQLIGKDKSTVTSLVASLCRLGYVKKKVSDKDKRITYISLSDKGKSIKNQYLSISEEVQSTAFKNFTEEEKKEFMRLLKRMNMNFSTELKK